ncbi:MAG: hypothetical protein J6Y75_02045 [Spirochaetaceae bacterium]|nr:hypothetical protein [Spirochaetaceae bacterium]
MLKLSKKQIIINYLIFCTIWLLGMTALVSWAASKFAKQTTVSVIMDKGWTITLQNKIYQNVTLSEFDFPPLKVSDEIVLEKSVLPLSIQNPVIRIYTTFCAVEMYENEKLEYSYGQELFKKGITTGSGYHTIPVRNPNGITNLKIKLTVTEPNAFNILQPVYAESAEDTLISLFKNTILVLISSSFFIVLGITIIIIAFLLYLFSNPVKDLFVIGLTSFFMGTLIMCINGCLVIFSHNYVFNTWIEYIAKGGTTLSLIFLFYKDIAKTRTEKRIYLFLTTLFFMYFLTVLFIDKIAETHFILILFIIAEVIITIAISFRHIKNEESFAVLPTITFIAFGILLSINFFSLGTAGYSDLKLTKIGGNTLSIMTLFSLLILIATLILKLQENMEALNYKTALEEYNKTDYLTGFPNKLKYDEITAGPRDDTQGIKSVFAIQLMPAGTNVPMYGELEADNFLVNFTNIICNVFSKSDLMFTFKPGCFTVLSGGEDIAAFNNQQKQLNNMLFEQIQKNPRMQYQLKTGFAFVSENNTIDETRLAAEKAAGIFV